MPNFNLNLYSLDQIPGVPTGSTSAADAFNTGGTVTFSDTANAITITDDDSFLEDYATRPTYEGPETGANSVLTNAVTVDGTNYAAGTQINAVAQVEVTNTTTGQTGFAQIVTFGGTSFSAYLAYPFSVSPGDSLTFIATNNTPLDGNAFAATQGYDYSLFDGAVIPCFTATTLIKTQSGERPIEDLTAGDMVLTMDHGYQPIRWIGSSKRAATGDLAPILIRKGALGNDRDLRVSPQHRMLLQGWQAELMHGENEVLATAKSLINDHSITRVECDEVEYFHMLFDTHEIIWAEGVPSESFHPGEQGWKGLDEPTRNEILELFPELAEGDFEAYGPSARLSLKHKEGVLLAEYMVAPQA